MQQQCTFVIIIVLNLYFGYMVKVYQRPSVTFSLLLHSYRP